MLLHPELGLALAREHQRELVTQAERRRLLAAAREYRRHRADRAGRVAASRRAQERPDGTLAPCAQRVGAPAR